MCDLGSWDYVIVGVGMVGCVFVNCLLEDLDVNVLFLEVGKKDNYIWVYILVGYFYCIGNLWVDWGFKMVFDLGFNGCFLFYLCGKVLGGCLFINGMIYMCGQVWDYDYWCQLGLVGWGWDDVLFYFKKFEDYYVWGDDLYV